MAKFAGGPQTLHAQPWVPQPLAQLKRQPRMGQPIISQLMPQKLMRQQLLLPQMSVTPGGSKRRLQLADEGTRKKIRLHDDQAIPERTPDLESNENQILPEREIKFAVDSLDEIYRVINTEWNTLKASIGVLLEDIDYILTRYFKETGQKKQANSVPTIDDIINSYKIFPTKNDWIGRPLLQFVNLLDSIKQSLSVITQIKERVSHIGFQKSVIDILKKIEDLAEGKEENDKTHQEVSNITKNMKLSKKKSMYTKLISTIPHVLDDIKQVQEKLNSELTSMGTRDDTDFLSLPVMLEATTTTSVVPVRSLSHLDAQAISMYRNHIKDLEEELSFRALENHELYYKNLVLSQSQSQRNDQFGFLDAEPPLGDVNQGTGLEKMLRNFHQKVSNCKLKDVSEINFTTSIFAAGIFDTRGGNLTIKDADVNLYIPSGAIPKGTRKEIYIYLDPHAHLKLENKQETRVAPIIHCGPPGTSFDEPFVLSFPHNAENTKEWKFSGMIQDSRDPKNQWQNIKNGSEGMSIVQGGYCIIMVNHFTNFTMKGSTGQQEGAKIIHMCTFGKSYDKRNSYSFNFRAWNPHDYEAVKLEQDELKEIRMDSTKALKVKNTGRNVKVSLSDLKSGWVSTYKNEEEQEISHDQLWYENGGTPPSCRFHLKTKDSTQQDFVKCRVKCKQDGGTDEIVLYVDPGSKVQNSEVQDRSSSTFIDISTREFGSLTNLQLGLPDFLCYQLMLILDVKRETLHDWRGLAMQIPGCEAFIELYDQKSDNRSPTLKLLRTLKKNTPPDEFPKTLCKKLKAVGNHKAYKVLKAHLGEDSDYMD